MIKITENDFKNFNNFIRRLRECRVDLNCFRGQEDRFCAEIKKLNLFILDYEYKLEIIKCSLGVLCDTDLLVITDYYFAKTPINDIAIKLNVSSSTVSRYKKRAIEELAKIMYGHLEDFDDISFRDIPIKKKEEVAEYISMIYKETLLKDGIQLINVRSDGFNASGIRDCCEAGDINNIKDISGLTKRNQNYTSL